MFRKEVILTFAALALTVSLTAPPDESAQGNLAAYPKNGVVYVETNNSAAGENAVLAFRRSPDGLLTL
jgi:hypothetical protein